MCASSSIDQIYVIVSSLTHTTNRSGQAEARKGDEAFLRLTHKLLLDVHVTEGALICPETGRRFPIHEGIPNMLLHEDEV